MTKTDLTKKVEKALWEATRDTAYGCFEVKVGFPKTQELLTGREEFVDYMTFSSAGEIVCYEIKTSKSDLKSSAALSFIGHRNYLVLPEELYEEVKDQDFFRAKLSWGIGIMCYCSGGLLDTMKIVKKCKKYTLSIGAQTLLMESISRSMARETNRYYKATLESEVEVVTLSKKDYQKQQKEHKATKKDYQGTKQELGEFKEAFWPIMRFMLDHKLITTGERWDNQLVCNKLLEYLEVGQKKG